MNNRGEVVEKFELENDSLNMFSLPQTMCRQTYQTVNFFILTLLKVISELV